MTELHPIRCDGCHNGAATIFICITGDVPTSAFLCDACSEEAFYRLRRMGKPKGLIYLPVGHPAIPDLVEELTQPRTQDPDQERQT